MTAECINCGAIFEPIKPKCGPTSKRCLDCYPLAERKRVLSEVRDCIRRRRGEHVPNVRICRGCGLKFDRLKGRMYCTPECRSRAYQEARFEASRAKWMRPHSRSRVGGAA